tara:strand:+ start:178 stop:1323 length:1146 start_codon:yes stop_codon:yes gene_type:complete
MFRGWIYKITYKNALDGKNRFPEMCYIGQHRGTTVQTRFNQHKREAKKFEHSASGRTDGKFAKLHETMRIARVENFIFEVIETFESDDEVKLGNMLNDAELRYIKEFDSIEHGWNTVAAPQTVAPRTSKDRSLAEIAREHGVVYNSLRHRVNKLEETIEDAVSHLKKMANKPKVIYEYKRQRFDSITKISKSKIHNRNNLKKKSIEVRIRKLKNDRKLEQYKDEENNELVLKLPDSVFSEVKSTQVISVETPHGEVFRGTIAEVFRCLKQKFPMDVPGYSTVVNRLGKAHWNSQQAFGFEYPPDLLAVKSLIEEHGYKWAVVKPDFKRQDSKPVILHSKKEVFTSQNEFADEYGLAPDLVSDHLNKGKTPEQILSYFKLNP